MKPRPPAATPWNGASLAMIFGGALGLSLVGAGWAWSSIESRPVTPTAAAAADARLVAPSGGEVTHSHQAEALSYANRTRRAEPRDEVVASASAETPSTAGQGLPPAGDNGYVGGILQHLAHDVEPVTVTVSESVPANHTEAPGSNTDPSINTETVQAPAPQTARTGLARPRLSDDASSPEDRSGESGPTAPPTPSADAPPLGPAPDSVYAVQADDPAPGLTAEERFQQDAQRFISFYNIAWSTDSPAHRNIGWGVATRGWPTFVRFHIEPQIELGVRRFQLHNPFGGLANEPMQLDQLLHAQEAGLLPVTTRFVEAWKPITDQGVEVIAYVGCGLHDADFRELPLDQWLERAFRSVQPCLDAGMSIGLDAAVGAEAGSPTHVFAQRLRERGVKVYVESKPTRHKPHWHDFHVISLDQTWLNADIEHGHPQARNHYGIPNDLLTGEVVRMIRPREGETQDDLNQFSVFHSRIRDILDDGHTVSAGIYLWVKQGRTLRDLLYVDDRQAAYD